MNFETIRFEKWEDVQQIEPEWGGWVYRGHANPEWNLETSFTRRLLAKSGELGQAVNSEHWMLREFRRRAHLYKENNLPNHENVIEWLAMMQHYGCATRLFDFTWSFYVACYFAVIHAEDEACIWAIRDSWLSSFGVDYIQDQGYEVESINLRDDRYDFIFKKANTIISNLYSEFKHQESFNAMDPGVLIVEPIKQIKRLASQQGLFLIPMDITKTFWENLLAVDDLVEEYNGRKHYKIRKIELSNDFVQSARMQLKTMNITAETLFPGVEGLAKSVANEWIF